PTNRPTVTDKAWGNVGLYEVVIMGITHERTKEGGANYNFYHNAVQSASTMEILPENYIAPSAAGNMFQLMVSMPGTAFSIRVYNRTLTEAEMAQNKLADLAYYFGLDVSRVLELADMMGEASSHLYKSLENLSFNMAQEDAQRVLDNYVAATWLSFDTVGVRKGDADYTRYYFTCNPAAVIAMVGVGYTVEMGALINVGKNVAPTLEGDAYDYRLNMYGSASGRNSAFYVDEDTFGVTVRYTDTDKAAGLANVFVRGYIKMTDENGEVTIYYADASAEIAKQDNLFKLYDSMLSNAGLRSDAGTLNRMRTVIEKCYTTRYVYVDAAAEAGGNGSADAPYRSFASGFAACKDILSKNGIPLRLVMMLADGEYGIYETQELSDTDIAYKYTSFEITSESGKSTLTTTKEIDTPFEKYSSYIWVTQLEKEEDGSYPCFRYLYVDGEIADLAYNGGRYTADTVTKYVSGYERTYDGPWGKAYEKYKNKSLTKDTKSGYPASRRDLDALFEKYKKGFLALREAETKFNAGGMTPATECDDTTDAEYVAYFNQFKLRILVLADMKKQYSRLDGTPTQNYQDFIKYSAKDFDDSAYRTEYETVRTHISKNLDQLSLSSFDTYNAMVESDAMADSKYYLREELVGDLHDAIAAGKARNEAALKALEEKYAASDANTQALLQPELEKARLKTGEYTWFRYALEDCGPEMYQAGQWWHNIVHVNGVDYDDYVIDSSGKKHVAVYMEPEEYKNFFIHKTYQMTGRYVFMKNALAYVDSQGEYYYDEPTGKLYYYWAGDISDKSFARATSDYMLYFKNADNITVSGLRITG
ncbi:MAG: hypothetical protein J6R89_06530, partial [Clostridia bacterium]|nr:hypothetical protein [Clostridia bacterium]